MDILDDITCFLAVVLIGYILDRLVLQPLTKKLTGKRSSLFLYDPIKIINKELVERKKLARDMYIENAKIQEGLRDHIKKSKVILECSNGVLPEERLEKVRSAIEEMQELSDTIQRIQDSLDRAIKTDGDVREVMELLAKSHI